MGLHLYLNYTGDKGEAEDRLSQLHMSSCPQGPKQFGFCKFHLLIPGLCGLRLGLKIHLANVLVALLKMNMAEDPAGSRWEGCNRDLG